MSHKFHLFKKLQKMSPHQLNSKNNSLVLLFKTIFGYRICFLSSFTTNGEDRHELKLEKIGPNFSSCSAMLAKITIQIYGWCSLLKLFDICLIPRRLSFDENVPAKEGGKETTGETCRLYPSPGTLQFITSHSRFAIASAIRKTKRLRRRLI